MFKRLVFLIGINVGIIISLNIIVFLIDQIFGISLFTTLGQGQWLIIMAVVLGFGGAIINLFISKRSAKRLYTLIPIQVHVNQSKLRLVYDTVSQISSLHTITPPEVTYYKSQEINAFATGSSKNNSLVAVSSGLLNAMNDEEIKAVIWHEMAHILNGDMVTSTLLQWSLNTFTILIARIVGGLIDRAINNNSSEEGDNWRGMGYFIIVNTLEFIFGIVSGLILMSHSRTREYKADVGSARMISKDAMIAALRKLWSLHNNPIPNDGFTTMKISGWLSWMELRASHPPITKRIEQLQKLTLM